MYYRYNNKCEIIEKSETELNGENVVTSTQDFDIELFRIIVGHINEKGQISRHTKFVRSAEEVARRILEYQGTVEEFIINQAESELYIEERLCNIELGFN